MSSRAQNDESYLGGVLKTLVLEPQEGDDRREQKITNDDSQSVGWKCRICDVETENGPERGREGD